MQPQPGEDTQPRPRPGSGPTPGGEQTPDGDARRLEELLRRWQDTRRDAGERQADSERLREAARRLADNLSEEEKRRLIEQWQPRAPEADTPDAGGGTPSGQGETLDPSAEMRPPVFTDMDDVDLREDAPPDIVLSEWLDREASPDDTRTGEGRTLIRRARSAAEQAVDRAVVPSRYHELIRRYFRRLEETVEHQTTPPAAEPSP